MGIASEKNKRRRRLVLSHNDRERIRQVLIILVAGLLVVRKLSGLVPKQWGIRHLAVGTVQMQIQ